jgi:nitrite reductase (NADH) large subunit
MERNETVEHDRIQSMDLPRMGRVQASARPVSKPLLVTALAGLMLLALSGLIGMDSTWPRVPREFDALWRDSFRQQTSGFALLAIYLLSLGISLRKRWRRCAWGRLGAWRLGHALLGCFSLVLFGVHTGFQRGGNFNQLLWLAFLGLILFGVLTGMVAALEGRRGRNGASWRRVLFLGAHLLSFWIMAVLIMFHILTVYYF